MRQRWVVAGALVAMMVAAVASLPVSHRWKLARLRAATELPSVQEQPENRAAHYIAALQLLPIDRISYGKNLLDDSLDGARDVLAEHGNALATLRTAFRHPRCRTPVFFSNGKSGPERIDNFPYYQGLQNLAQLLLAASHVALDKRDDLEAVTLGLECVQMGCDVASAGPIDQAASGYHIAGLGCRALATAITERPLTPDAIEALEEGLRNLSFEPPSNGTLLKNTGNFYTLLRAEYNDPTSLRDILNRVLHPEMSNFSTMAYGTEFSGVHDIRSAYCIDEVLHPLDLWPSLDASLKIIRIGTAIQRYAHGQGYLTETLEQLAPNYLPSIPPLLPPMGSLAFESSHRQLRIYTGGRAGRELTFTEENLVPNP